MTSIAREELPDLSLDEMDYGKEWIVYGPFGPPFAGGPTVSLHHLNGPEPISVTVSRTIFLKHWSYRMSVDRYTALLVDACKLWQSPPGLRLEGTSAQTDNGQDIVDFSFSIRSSSKDLAAAYAAAESLLTMILDLTDPKLEASGRRLSERESRYLE